MKTFCHFPWSNITRSTNGDLKPCCQFLIKKYDTRFKNANEYWNSDLLKSIRNDMLNGKEIKGCSICYDEEKVNKASLRQKSNYFDDITDLFISNTNKDGSYNLGPLRLDLKLSNLCNLKCRMCIPELSIQIKKEYEDLDKNSLLFDDQKLSLEKSKDIGTDEDFFNQCKDLAGHLKRIYASGGEPLINENFYSFLEYCVDQGYSKNINISVSSNFATLPDKFLELAKSFKKIFITISVDGTEDTLEYIRHPIKWESFVENVEKLKNYYKQYQNIAWAFCVVPQIYNAFNIKELIEYTKLNITHDEEDAIIDQSWLHYPDYLRIGILPNEIKNHIKTYLDTIVVDDYNKNLINGLYNELKLEYDEELFKKFIIATKRRDKIKRQKFENYNKMMWQYLENEWKKYE